MTFTVREKGDTIATLRFASVHMMETLARWIPTTPELEVKIVFGRHVWELAQHADALGKRTAELRLPVQYSRPPTEPFMDVLNWMTSTEATADRVDAFYSGMLSIMETRFRAYLDQTDVLMDEPSVRIIQRILTDYERMKGEREDLVEEVRDWLDLSSNAGKQLAGAAADADPFVDFRPAPAEKEDA